MPTTLPDPAARKRRQRPRMHAELVPIAAALLYLLLLAWSAASLATDTSALFASTQPLDRYSPGYNPEYNPMEPVGHTADAIIRRLHRLAAR